MTDCIIGIHDFECIRPLPEHHPRPTNDSWPIGAFRWRCRNCRYTVDYAAGYSPNTNKTAQSEPPLGAAPSSNNDR